MKRFFRVVRGVFLTLFSIAVLGAGGWLAYHLMTNKPQPERRRPPQSAPLVEVEALQPVREQIIVPVMGTVIPAVDVTLQARVAGEITATHPQLIDGGVVRKGDVLVTIDPRDYQLALVSAEAQLESARYNLKVEEGQQDVAQREWELLDMQEEASELDQELALRKPHLRQRQAALRAAEAQVEQARLDLERTQVKAPFNAVIQEAYVDRGDQAAQQTQLATLIGTDVYWVRVSVKNECLQWIQFPDGHGTAGSAVRVHTRTGAVREGRVLNLLSDLEPNGLLAQALVEVPDPLDMESGADSRNPLLLGDYLNVEILGRYVENVFVIPRATLRDGSNIWLVDADSRLVIQPVEPVWGDDARVLVRGIEPGAGLIVSDLPTPVAGMELRRASDASELGADESEPAAGPEDSSEEGAQ